MIISGGFLMTFFWMPTAHIVKYTCPHSNINFQRFPGRYEISTNIQDFREVAEHDCPADFWEVVIYDVELCWLPESLIKTQRIAVRGVLWRFKDPPPDPVEPLALGIQQVKNIFWNIYPVGIMEKWKKITGGVIGALLLLVVIVVATVVSLNARWTAS